MTSVYANPRWIRERPTALLDATTLVVDWIGRVAHGTSAPRRPETSARAAAERADDERWLLAA